MAGVAGLPSDSNINGCDTETGLENPSKPLANPRRCRTSAPDEGCLKFLRALARWQGIASPQDLGPQTSQDENRARQKCKRRGWVTYDGGNVGYWRMTDAGRAALRGTTQ